MIDTSKPTSMSDLTKDFFNGGYMARSKSENTAPADDGIDTKKVDEALDASMQLAQMADESVRSARAMALRVGYEHDGDELTAGALEDEVRFYQRRSVEAALELGKRLLVLKELVGHGEFTRRLELLNIGDRTAQRFMSATLKFGNANAGAVLKAAGNTTKMLELLVLDDDAIEVLSEGGDYNGLDLEDIDKMSVRELKQKIREAKQEAEIKDKLIAEKNKKIDALQLNNELQVNIDWIERTGCINDQIVLCSSNMKTALAQLDELRRGVIELEADGANEQQLDKAKLQLLQGLELEIFEASNAVDGIKYKLSKDIAIHGGSSTEA